MNVLAIGDLHGQVAWLPQALAQRKPDLLLCTGDWGDPGQVEEALYQEVVDRVHVLSVYGNHDDRALLGRLQNTDGTPVLLAQGEARQVGDLVIAGISGIWAKTRLGAKLTRQWEAARRRNPSLTWEEWIRGQQMPPYITDEDVEALAARLTALTTVHILLTHGCPIGLADKTPTGRRGGQACFRRAFDRIRPRLLVCGHLHLRQREDLPDGRLVLNTGYGAERQGWWIQWESGAFLAQELEA